MISPSAPSRHRSPPAAMDFATSTTLNVFAPLEFRLARKEVVRDVQLRQCRILLNAACKGSIDGACEHVSCGVELRRLSRKTTQRGERAMGKTSMRSPARPRARQARPETRQSVRTSRGAVPSGCSCERRALRRAKPAPASSALASAPISAARYTPMVILEFLHEGVATISESH